MLRQHQPQLLEEFEEKRQKVGQQQLQDRDDQEVPRVPVPLLEPVSLDEQWQDQTLCPYPVGCGSDPEGVLDGAGGLLRAGDGQPGPRTARPVRPGSEWVQGLLEEVVLGLVRGRHEPHLLAVLEEEAVVVQTSPRQADHGRQEVQEVLKDTTLPASDTHSSGCLRSCV